MGRHRLLVRRHTTSQEHKMSHCVTMTDKVSSREALDCHDMSRKPQQSSAHINNCTHHASLLHEKLGPDSWDLVQTCWKVSRWHFVWCHGLSCGESLKSSNVTDPELRFSCPPSWCHQNVIIPFQPWSCLYTYRLRCSRYKSQAKPVKLIFNDCDLCVPSLGHFVYLKDSAWDSVRMTQMSENLNGKYPHWCIKTWLGFIWKENTWNCVFICVCICESPPRNEYFEN